MRRAAGALCLVIFATIYMVALDSSDFQARSIPPRAEGVGALPAPFLKILALEFDTLAADMLFVDALVFYGETLERTSKPRVQDWEWPWLYSTLETVTEIDPWFYDPYYFASAVFPWEGHLVREANTLLERGTEAREWDWTLPFYAGFNEFYFLQNNERASELLMVAAKRPGALSIIPSLATRLAYRDNQTENAIRFLVEFIQTLDDPGKRAKI